MKSYLSYLTGFRSVGGGATNQEGTEFNDIGLELSLINVREFLPSLAKFTQVIDYKPLDIETIDTSFEINRTGKAFLKNKSDKSGPNHRYDLVYHSIFEELGFDNKLNILEIGLGTNNDSFASYVSLDFRPGASLFAYKELFPNALVYGGDIDKDILFEEDRIKTSFVDQLRLSTFMDMHNSFNRPSYNLFIEDGLHSLTASLNSLIFGLKTVQKNGYIILEDLYNPYNVWQIIGKILQDSNTVHSVRLANSGGLMLIVKV